MAHGAAHPYTDTGRREDEYMEYEDGGRSQAAMDEALQRRRYGGLNIGAAFFGWLVSTGLGAILVSLLAAAGAAVAVSQFTSTRNITVQNVDTVGIVSGILLLIVLAVSYYAGGYVAGRMSRFDGARQGVGVWVIGVIITILLAIAGAAIGYKYNVVQQLNLLHIPIKSGNFTTGGLVTTLIALVITLFSAIQGGRVGVRYHRKVNDAAIIER
jgi:hypothetical protein